MSWIRERREKMEISQDDLARRLQLAGVEVDRSLIGHWENGRRQPRIHEEKFRKALAQVFEMDENEIMSLAGLTADTSHTEEGERAAYIVDRLKPEDREKAVRILEALAG